MTAFLLQAIFVGEIIGVLSVIGSFFIIIGCTIVLVCKLFENRYVEKKEQKDESAPESFCNEIILFKF